MPGPGFAAWQAVTLGAVALSSVRLRSPALRLGRAGRVAAGGGEPWRSGSPAAAGLAPCGPSPSAQARPSRRVGAFTCPELPLVPLRTAGQPGGRVASTLARKKRGFGARFISCFTFQRG